MFSWSRAPEPAVLGESRVPGMRDDVTDKRPTEIEPHVDDQPVVVVVNVEYGTVWASEIHGGEIHSHVAWLRVPFPADQAHPFPQLRIRLAVRSAERRETLAGNDVHLACSQPCR